MRQESTRLPIDRAILDAVQHEARRAHRLHADHSVLSVVAPDLTKLAALTEELGEVGELFTPDKKQMHGDTWVDAVFGELLQLANVALSWVECLDGDYAISPDLVAPPTELSTRTLDAVQAAALRAYRGPTPISVKGSFTDRQRLAALGYGYGQVCRHIWTVDKYEPRLSRQLLVDALLTLASHALLWVQRLDNSTNDTEEKQ